MSKRASKRARKKQFKKWLSYLQSYMWMKTLRSTETQELDLYYDGTIWMAFPIPQGRRVLIATRNNTTLVISKDSVTSC